MGIAFATFGLIAGGLVGAQVAKRLITKHNLRGPAADDRGGAQVEKAAKPIALFDILTGILVLAICVELGHAVNRFLFEKDVLLPGFLTAMFVGIIITNLADLFKFKTHEQQIGRASDVSLKRCPVPWRRSWLRSGIWSARTRSGARWPRSLR